jgi:hypothetical protein
VPYRGAVDGLETQLRAGGTDSGLPPTWYYGAVDRIGNLMPTVTANLAKYTGAAPDPAYATGAPFPASSRLIEGNPFDLSRTAAPQAAAPCVDDEANDGEIDVDESNTYQVRARNDPTRVEAGIMNRRTFLDPYLRETVEVDENRRWWGVHEL